MTKPYVSIIIPTYKRADKVGITLESFLRQSYPEDRYEIIVADNNSPDNTREVIGKFQNNGRIRIHYLFEEKQGVHYARNAAAHHAHGEILYFTDDDMIADPSLLIEIVRPFELDTKIGVATGRILPEWEITPPRWVLAYCQNYLLSLNDKGPGLEVSENDIGVFSCHQAMRREAFFGTGGFHPENTAGEWIGDGETGLCLMLKAQGWKFAYNGMSITRHMIPPFRMTQDYLNKRLANQGNCDSYTDFRKFKWSNAELLQRIQQYPMTIYRALCLYQELKAKGDDSWRGALARVHYWMARSEYDFRIIQDPAWKALVLKDDWLHNPNL
jgi:glycosyltransferase involved in cell wall biosynthesis